MSPQPRPRDELCALLRRRLDAHGEALLDDPSGCATCSPSSCTVAARRRSAPRSGPYKATCATTWLADAGAASPPSSSSPRTRIWSSFVNAKRDVVAAYLHNLPALDATTRLIDGFESPLGMELVATVDWLLHEQGCEPTVQALRAARATWPGGADAGERKLRAFDERRVGLALDRLTHSSLAEPARLLC